VVIAVIRHNKTGLDVSSLSHIAVIGSGISGLSAAWLLSQKHNVTLFEAANRLGGHSNTIDVRLPDGRTLPIDTGFIVSNSWTYPNFTALMDYLDVALIKTKMTFSVTFDGGAYEYSGDHLGTMLGRARQWVSPTHWRLVSDLVRFYKTAEKDAERMPDGLTLEGYLLQNAYSRGFIDRHILPIAGSIWSSGQGDIAKYPFKAFVKFFANHKLFMLGDRPLWQTVKGGARSYVEALAADGKFETVLNTPITSVRRSSDGVTLGLGDGRERRFDHVVIATHGDQALGLLADPSGAETALLSPFCTSRNTAVLHRDKSLMPRGRRFWAAWNYHGDAVDEARVAVTYWMNALQHLDSPQEHFVSLNPPRMPDAGKIDQVLTYRHPVFTPETLAAQKQLWSLQGQNRTWFCGAWFGAGFHEDGLQAGLAVAEQLGHLRRPWDVADESSRIYVGPWTAPTPTMPVKAAE
jgi:uncharacterized protein